MAATFTGTRDIPITDLARFPGNARRGNTEQIRRSIRRNGQYRALVVRDTGNGYVILAGNHTADALEAEGHTTARCELLRCDDATATRINLADNRLSDIAADDPAALSTLLASLDGDLDGTGWDIADPSPGYGYGPDGYGDAGDGPAPTPAGVSRPARGDQLALAGVTLPEPRHQPTPGQVWALGVHRLVIGDVFTGWPQWVPLLSGDAVFCPYPTPLAPHTPADGPLVMVQPDLYLAAVLLDKWQDITGSKPAVEDAA